MSFVDDADSLKAKLHLHDIPVPLRIGLGVLCAAILFVLFQGLWQLNSGETHLIAGQAQSSWGEEAHDGGVTVVSEDESGGAEDESAATIVSVHVVGAVKTPGLYEVADGSRVKDAIDAAGGMSGDAVEGSVNLARVVQDGEQIVVASKSDSGSASLAGAAGSSSSPVSSSATGGLININTADASALTTLSGIGESTAKKIIADREKNGPFKNKKDITRISGIGDKKYEAIKEAITV